MPDVFVIGGPNGAGKTTAAHAILPSYLGVSQFVNADDIARGLSAFAPESVAMEAGRLMLQRIGHLARQRVDFAFETTLASRSFVPWLTSLQKEGYGVNVIYVWLPTWELAVERVARRFLSGGHTVPTDVIRRRYERGRENFLKLYMPLADAWRVYNNAETNPQLIAFGGTGTSTIVLEREEWMRILRSTV